MEAKEIEFVDEDGIEKEELTDDSSIHKPFNPKDVKIEFKPITIDLLIKRIERNEIDLYTDFQRGIDLWSKTKQSRLIESLLIRFPLPVFYFDASDDNKWLIVDGLQRISTLKNFIIDKSLKLENLEYLNLYNGITFDKLPRELQRRIEETQIITYQIAEGTPHDVKFNLFKRINTGGLILEPQEIRHALNQGIPADFIKELAESAEFINATQNSVKTKRMKDRDLVNRFIAFYCNEYIKYDSDLDSYLNDAMGRLKEVSQDDRLAIKKQFYQALNLALNIFENYAFRKKTIAGKRGPINKSLFDVVTVSFAKLSKSEICYLLSNKTIFLEKYYALIQDELFLRAITSNTGGVQNVKTRFNKFEELINTIIGNKNDK